MQTTHELKTWPEYYQAVVLGTKKFEIRKNDREYKVGDMLLLREWQPQGYNEAMPETLQGYYTGCETTVRVDYIFNGGNPDINPFLGNRICMSITVLTPQEYATQEKQDDIDECINALADLWRSLKQLGNQADLSEHHIRRMDKTNEIMQRYVDPNQPLIVQSSDQEKQGWVKTLEAKPEREDNFLVIIRGTRCIRAFSDDEFIDADGIVITKQISHWRELPQKPEV